MTGKPLSDTEIIAQDERSHRAALLTLASVAISMVTVFLILYAGQRNLFSMWWANVLATVVFFAWLLIVLTHIKPWSEVPVDGFDEAYLRKTIDVQHRRWRFVILSLLLNVCVIAASLTISILRLRNEGFFLSLIAAMYAFMALMAVLAISFGPGFLVPSNRRALNDELTRAQQARTAKFGFILAVVAMCGVLVAAAYKPHWGLAALPGAIAAVIALPGIYFLILQWRAGRDG